LRLLTVLVVLAATLLLAATLAADPMRRRSHDPGCRSESCDDRIDAWLGELRERWELAHERWRSAIASWYDDAGETACRTHYARGLASLSLACGTAVHLCYHGCEIAYVQDRGPYVGGRLFDLNPGARDAINCTDLCGQEGGRLSWYVR
jgi:hypothetical protein